MIHTYVNWWPAGREEVMGIQSLTIFVISVSPTLVLNCSHKCSKLSCYWPLHANYLHWLFTIKWLKTINKTTTTTNDHHPDGFPIFLSVLSFLSNTVRNFFHCRSFHNKLLRSLWCQKSPRLASVAIAEIAMLWNSWQCWLTWTLTTIVTFAWWRVLLTRVTYLTI